MTTSLLLGISCTSSDTTPTTGLVTTVSPPAVTLTDLWWLRLVTLDKWGSGWAYTTTWLFAVAASFRRAAIFFCQLYSDEVNKGKSIFFTMQGMQPLLQEV